MPAQEGEAGLRSRDRTLQHPVNGLGTPSKYQYRPLQDQGSFRILILAPAKPDDPLKGSLEVVNIHTVGSYEPISYVWKEPGPPNRTYEISIREGDDERSLELRGGSLFAALVRLRLPDRPRRIWADQICINQDDPSERGQQVPLMNDIYKSASHVLVWLGLDASAEAKSAFHLIHHIDKRLRDEAERPKFHRQFTQDLERQTDEEWKALNHLTNRSWVSCSRRNRGILLTFHVVLSRLDRPRDWDQSTSNNILGR
jgi:Heterokaryon incompatibility protein (HET)